MFAIRKRYWALSGYTTSKKAESSGDKIMTFTRAIGVSISQSTMSGSDLQYCSVYKTKNDGTPELVIPPKTGLQNKWTHESLLT